jgi:hypothetical protein
MSTPLGPNSPEDTKDARRVAEEKAAAEKTLATQLAAAQSAAAEAAAAKAAVAQLDAARAAALQLAEAKIAEARAALPQTIAPSAPETKTEPKRRHEFVGMMFAVAIGEVGVQTAVLVQAGNWVHFLPAYSHLFLTAIVIAASWVGWTLSPSPGAREDVQSVFQWAFLVLLLDVFLVVIYFILAKTVDITETGTVTLNASARPEAFWILVIFGAYFVWDIVTKIVIYLIDHRTEPWFRTYGSRMIPTIICLILAYAFRPIFDKADPPHVVTADIALLSLVMLFRALKALADALTKRKTTKTLPVFWTILCLFGFGLGTVWTSSYPVPKSIAEPILREPIEPKNNPEVPTKPPQESAPRNPSQPTGSD